MLRRSVLFWVGEASPCAAISLSLNTPLPPLHDTQDWGLEKKAHCPEGSSVPPTWRVREDSGDFFVRIVWGAWRTHGPGNGLFFFVIICGVCYDAHRSACR